MYESKVRIHYQHKHFMRNSRGYSRKELIAAGISVDDALWMGIPVDKKRKSLYDKNVETILDMIDKIQALRSEMEEEKKAEISEQKEKAAEAKKAPKKKKAEKKKPKKEKPVEAEPLPAEEEAIPLDKIPGVGPKTAERLVEAGYSSASDIANADPAELENVKGISKKSAAEIIEKAKGL